MGELNKVIEDNNLNALLITKKELSSNEVPVKN